IVGLTWYLNDPNDGSVRAARWAERTDWIRIGPLDTAPVPEWERQRATDPARPTPTLALAFEVGYKIDHLTAVVFEMVTGICTLIFICSLGYMRDEAQEMVADHEVDKQRKEPPTAHGDVAHADGAPEDPAHATHGPGSPGHFHRRGRYGQFFLYLSLF